MKTLTLTGLTLAATLGFSALATGASAQGFIGDVAAMIPTAESHSDCFPDAPTPEEFYQYLLGIGRPVPPAPVCQPAFVLNAQGQLEPAGMLCRPAPQPTTGPDIIWD